MADAVPLPAASHPNRWQPVRCGLLNIYRYDYEEFRFEQGRLLLRGDNGTGKSRVLALQLPFLLDGDVSPARVEPDGDPAKRIEWHLLMGRWPDRTGYTWIEFGRKNPDGTEEFQTLGCGMRAVAGHSGLHSRWFFVTRQRVGQDLFLQNNEQRPLGRDRLEQALGKLGSVYASGEEYRRAVDAALFGLGPRYPRLIELLIRLRRPKLSQKLDEEELSTTLSEALPVLPTTLVDEVAEAFRSLETDRESLRGFAETRVAVEEFLREYSLYARVAVRRRAAAVRSAHSQYEVAQRTVRDAERRVAEAETHLGRIQTARAALDQDHAAAEESVRTLRASPEMRTAADLAHAEDAARSAESGRTACEEDSTKAQRQLATAQEHFEAALQQHETMTADAEARLWQAGADADAAAMTETHRQHLASPRFTDSTDDAQARAGKAAAAIDRALHQRREAIELLRTRENAVAVARRAWEASETERRRAADACTTAREEEHAARAALEEAAGTFHAAVETWKSGLIALPSSGWALDFEEASAWIEHREGPHPWRRLAEGVLRRTLLESADQLARWHQQIRLEDEAIAQLQAEQEQLEQGGVTDPPVLPGRRAPRAGRPGAPLWRLCDFRPEVPDPERAGLEAALEASGLLDAWLLPDGRLVDPETEDTFLHPDGSPENSSLGTHLGLVLVPALDAADPQQVGLSVSQVEGVLRRIGSRPDTGSSWVATDGAWRLGPLTGRWTKSAAAYLGESTRAEARRRRLAELREQRAIREAARERLQFEVRQGEARQDQANAEWASFPDERPTLQAGFRLIAATAAIGEAFVTFEKAERDTATRRAALGDSESRRDRDAADLRLSEWLGRLDLLDRALGRYEAGLSALWPTLRHWISTHEQREQASHRLARAQGESAERVLRLQKAAEESAAARSRFETLRAMHGATIAVVMENLRAAETRITDLRGLMEERRKEELEQTRLRTEALSDRDHAQTNQARHDETRRSAIASLEAFADQRLLAEADGQLAEVETGPWVVHRAVEIARTIEPLLSETPADDDAWRRRQDAIHGNVQELRDRLIAHNHQPETHQVEDFVLVRCVFQARSHTMTELRDAFAAEIRERERLLEAREREIIENHLLGEIAVELQRLVRGAEEWIASANRELAARPTSTGLRFRFAWEPALEGPFPAIRKSFLQTSALWSPAERTEITRFLQERIRAEQTANEQGSWRDHLAAALDYRRWHRFLVERQQEGQWRRLDKRTYGTGSGGEKALALTLPRFAAAAAHYRSARPDAPRLVMLDEAFAGIDPTMRGQCMGMLAQFDLDVVMTSELEWGCYPTVPGLAIYHLTTRPGIDAVATTLWIWNGRERRRGSTHLPPSTPPDSDPQASVSGDLPSPHGPD